MTRREAIDEIGCCQTPMLGHAAFRPQEVQDDERGCCGHRVGVRTDGV